MSGRSIKVRDLESEVQKIVSSACKQSLFDVADTQTVMNIRSAISQGLSALKTRGVIKGYTIDIQLNGTKLVGSVTYSPVQVVSNIVIDFNNYDSSDNFDRAMKGI